MSFLSRSGPSPNGVNTTSAEATESRILAIKQQVISQLALANAQELINKMNEKCFQACIKPGPSFTSSDEACLTRVSERYLEAFNIISKSYVARIGREREAAGALSSGDTFM